MDIESCDVMEKKKPQETIEQVRRNEAKLDVERVNDKEDDGAKGNSRLNPSSSS